ncbi:hypothetical protein RvY_16961 [Ramazzottius varieornatus]|uniref:Uncharacterized protein n=1 Tax=Ramazzottius varieornatus TaxID=947166 RepID=A0A1D1W7M5_RAMVA|nr:hypothetical protein RvY_16961 [Ramazzottius varieornatus]
MIDDEILQRKDGRLFCNRCTRLLVIQPLVRPLPSADIFLNHLQNPQYTIPLFPISVCCIGEHSNDSLEFCNRRKLR